MPGLTRADSSTFVIVMKRINEAIVNPAFLLVFFGAPVLSVAVLFVERSPIIYTAAALGVVTLIITFAANIPLNNALAAAPETGAMDEIRAHFESPWVRWHLTRTVTGIASLICLLVA